MFSRREILKFGLATGAASFLMDRFGMIDTALANTTTTAASLPLFGFSPTTPPNMDTSSIINPGTRVLDFTGTKWGASVGSPDLQINTSAIQPRTGVKATLGWGPITNSNETILIELNELPNGDPISFNGRFGIWIYCANQPGYGPNQTVDSSINIEMSTDATGNFGSGFGLSFNSNQLREGWNFLKYINNPVGHPLGIGDYSWGITTHADILLQPVYAIKIIANESINTGATWYLDSLWTGFKNKPQVVLGVDEDTPDFLTYCLPVFQSYNWTGYMATPYRAWTSGPLVVTNWNTFRPVLTTAAKAGWETPNITVNHIDLGKLTSVSDITYEVVAQTYFLTLMGLKKGLRYFCSPQSSSSRLSESIIKNLGFIAQRNFRKPNTTVTPFGVDNPQDMGAISMDLSTFSQIKTNIDIIAAYEDTNFLYWHAVTALGDPGDGSGYKDNVTMYQSTWDLAMEYIRSLELSGEIVVKKGFNDFFFGSKVQCFG